MPASSARKARRTKERRMRSMGVEVVQRVHIPIGSSLDDLAWKVAESVKLLSLNGADMTSNLAITVGKHPDFPGKTTIEAKASAKVKPDDCPGCPIDHAADAADEDEVGPTAGGGAA